MVTAKGAHCVCQRRENHCALSVPPRRGSEVQLLPYAQFPMVCMTHRVPRKDHSKRDDEVPKRRGKGVRHEGKSQVHRYKKKKREIKQTLQQLLQQSLCSDSCPMPSGREAQRGELHAAAAFSLNFYAALLPSKVTHSPPRTNFLTLTALNSNPHVPAEEQRHKELLGGAGDDREELQKNLYPQICNSHPEGITWVYR